MNLLKFGGMLRDLEKYKIDVKEFQGKSMRLELCELAQSVTIFVFHVIVHQGISTEEKYHNNQMHMFT
jgi:hypothetical protein